MSIFSRFFRPKLDTFDAAINNMLIEKGIVNARNVGGRFDIPPALEERMAKTNFPTVFKTATVIVSDKIGPNGEVLSAPFMVGELKSGGYGMVSLKNIGRPESLSYSEDTLNNRKAADMYRNTLTSGGIAIKPQNNFCYNVGSLANPVPVPAPAAPKAKGFSR